MKGILSFFKYIFQGKIENDFFKSVGMEKSVRKIS